MLIDTILVATDFSENAQVAFKKAYDFALQFKAKLHVLHVQDESNLRVAIKEGLLDEKQTDEDLSEAVETLTAERFSTMLAGIDRSAVALQSASRRGDAGKVIADYAGEVNAGMVVIGRRGAGVMMGLLNALVGSVAESVIRRSPCPVLIVRSDHE
ncbi:MAG TPA: universal stress protein [Blastocatellia bacterium]|nr:universal stress protein [Blastocatellia bacterium]